MTNVGHALSIGLLSLLFIAAGVNHFVSPGVYLKIMPEYLPWPLVLVHVSGFFEVLGGVGLAVPRLRRDAHKVAVANFHYIANAVVTTDQAVAAIQAAFTDRAVR